MWSLRFNWMPKCEWYMAMFVVRNMHRKGIKCHHEIGLCLQHILDIYLGSIVNTIERVHVIIEKERGSTCCCCCYYCLLLLFPNLRYKLNVFTSMKTSYNQSTITMSKYPPRAPQGLGHVQNRVTGISHHHLITPSNSSEQ